MSATLLHIVPPTGPVGFNRRIQDLAEAVGGVEDLMELSADALPDAAADRLLPAFRGAMQLLRLVRQELEALGLDVAEAEKEGAL